MATKANGLEEYKLVVVSTAHVSENANAIFESARELNIVFIQVLQYGWLLNFWTHDAEDEEDRWYNVLKENGVDDETIDNLHTIRNMGYEVIMFDRDASTISVLKDFYE